jgi:hypothetical protein
MEIVGVRSGKYVAFNDLKGLRARVRKFRIRREENSNPDIRPLSKETIESLENI